MTWARQSAPLLGRGVQVTEGVGVPRTIPLLFLTPQLLTRPNGAKWNIGNYTK
jgi:hypothetical protein